MIDVRCEDNVKIQRRGTISYLETPNITGGSMLCFICELKNSHQEVVKMKKTLKMMTESRLCD